MALPSFANYTIPLASTDMPATSSAWLWPWVVSGAIIILGLFVYGWSDVLRTHWRRVWAISGVCVTESLRRRVLWLTPLAMLGIVVVAQFQQPTDYQDAIRQTTKFCLFASALLVTVTAIILACTNLPREIENRVIYTIVTKPTTRLEIVLGKVLGYARISGMIILIMGLFTLVYLEFRARPMISALRAEVQKLPADSPVRATDEYYIHSGLLGTRSLEWGNDVQIYAEPPNDAEKWSLGGVGQYILLPFDLTSDEKDLMAAAVEKSIPMYLTVNLDIRQHPPDEQERRQAHDMGLDKSFNVPFPATSTTQPAEQAPLAPEVQVRFLDAAHSPLIKTMDPMNAGQRMVLQRKNPGEPFVGMAQIPADEANDVVREAAKAGRFVVQVSPNTPGTEFGVRGRAVSISCPVPGVPVIQMASDPVNPAQPAGADFGAYPIREGIRLTPLKKWVAGPVAVFPFRNVKVTPGSDGTVGMQVAVQIERTTDFKDDAEHSSGLATATLEVVNRKTGESSGQLTFSPETSRTEPVAIPAKYVAGGDFDVMLRDTMQGANIGLEAGQGGAIALVAADRNFVVNLVKSLFILWLLTLLVVIISIFCSTFVSWPIAVVLTLVILLSHWGVEQLGSALSPGQAGHAAVSTIGIRDPSSSAVISNSVDWLSWGLSHLSNILPDVSRFPVMEDIERGVSIPPAKVTDALTVILCYGLPMLVFSYVILRRKEVAP